MIEHFENWLNEEESQKLFEAAMSMPLEQRYLTIYEKTVAMPRLTAWCNDRGFGYRYSNQTTPTVPWHPDIKAVRDRLELLTGTILASVLINLYRDGNDSVGWHTDDEECFGENPIIVSLSVGATRTFKMKSKGPQNGASRPAQEKNKPLSYDLKNGDVIVLSKEHVTEWSHCLVKTTKPVGPRINFTFRSIN